MGEWVQVAKLPSCDVCGGDARVDVKTTFGPWGNFCVQCAADARWTGVWLGQLGTGYGQVLTLNDDPNVAPEVLRDIEDRLTRPRC
jgi:hypothetical protein